MCVYRVVEQLHDKCGHTPINTNEEVDAGKNHISCAGHAEHEGGGIHHRSDGPAVTTRQYKKCLNTQHKQYICKWKLEHTERHNKTTNP